MLQVFDLWLHSALEWPLIPQHLQSTCTEAVDGPLLQFAARCPDLPQVLQLLLRLMHSVMTCPCLPQPLHWSPDLWLLLLPG